MINVSEVTNKKAPELLSRIEEKTAVNVTKQIKIITKKIRQKNHYIKYCTHYLLGLRLFDLRDTCCQSYEC